MTLYAGFLERRSAVVSPETPALLHISSDLLYCRNGEYTPKDDNIRHDELDILVSGFTFGLRRNQRLRFVDVQITIRLESNRRNTIQWTKLDL